MSLMRPADRAAGDAVVVLSPTGGLPLPSAATFEPAAAFSPGMLCPSTPFVLPLPLLSLGVFCAVVPLVLGVFGSACIRNTRRAQQ